MPGLGDAFEESYGQIQVVHYGSVKEAWRAVMSKGQYLNEDGEEVSLGVMTPSTGKQFFAIKKRTTLRLFLKNTKKMMPIKKLKKKYTMN